MKKKINILIIIAALLLVVILVLLFMTLNKKNSNTIKVNVTDLVYEKNKNKEDIKVYTQDDFDKFLSDYENRKLPELYVTEFLFDGVGMYKTYDLDDFIESGNDVEVKTLKITAFNINATGDFEFNGEILGGMIAVNTNDVSGSINIILNNVSIDTDSKKVPAIYVYNKDVTYTKAKVTISAKENTLNYIEGGKLKKVSLVPSDNLDDFITKYSKDASNWYSLYTNYYGVYTDSEIDNILFAKVTADNEDLADGDPYYFYKASGAISSDIDLYFEGSGYLEVTSKNKEGIETKGNLTFSGGIGDYVISAQDDCLNTTTDSKEIENARNTLTIDVNSMYAIVSTDANEGDAIDSNGELIINGGTIVAIAKPGSDAGIDSETGTYINGGLILATGDMYDEISDESKQAFMVLSFNGQVNENETIALVDSNGKAVFVYNTDRTYTNLVYSSKDLEETYYLYKGGSYNETGKYGVITDLDSYDFTEATLLGYSSSGIAGGMVGRGNMNNNMDGKRPEKPEGEEKNFPDDDNRPTPPSDSDNMMDLPEKPEGDNYGNEFERPEGLDTEDKVPPSGDNIVTNPFNGESSNATNKEFTIDGIANLFSGVAEYSDE